MMIRMKSRQAAVGMTLAALAISLIFLTIFACVVQPSFAKDTVAKPTITKISFSDSSDGTMYGKVWFKGNGKADKYNWEMIAKDNKGNTSKLTGTVKYTGGTQSVGYLKLKYKSSKLKSLTCKVRAVKGKNTSAWAQKSKNW